MELSLLALLAASSHTGAGDITLFTPPPAAFAITAFALHFSEL